MSQEKYDIAVFLVQNKDVIREHLKTRMECALLSERLFDTCPDLFEEMYSKKLVGEVVKFINENMTDVSYEDIMLYVDKNFVKITLQL